jgi:hypothetical protein
MSASVTKAEQREGVGGGVGGVGGGVGGGGVGAAMQVGTDRGRPFGQPELHTLALGQKNEACTQ